MTLPVRHPLRVGRWVIAVCLGILLIMVGWKAFTSLSQRADIKVLQLVVSDWQSGLLQADQFGVLTLPPQYRGFTVDGNAYVTVIPGKGYAIFFPAVRGKGANVRGLLFSEAPLTLSQSVTIKSPSAPSPEERKRNLGKTVVADVEVVVESSIDLKWYRVWRSLD